MIILIGGVPRSGKTVLANHLFEKQVASVLHLDIIRQMFEHAMPNIGIANGNDADENAERMWPFIKAFIQEAMREEQSYIIEGSDLLPRLVNELLPTNSIQVVFLGYSEQSIPKKIGAIKQYDDCSAWTNGMDSSELEKLVKASTRRSAHFKAECERLEIPYFEIMDDFNSQISQCAEFLLINEKTRRSMGQVA